MEKEFPLKEETYNIIGAAMEVHKQLGNGFLEGVYQEALALELEASNIDFEKEAPLIIFYKDKILKKRYIADFICYEQIILEIKALTELRSEHDAQVLNNLKATNMKVGLLLNFGSKSLQYKRIVL